MASEHKRIGLLVPSANSVMEPDFYRHLPQDTTLHTARMYFEESSVASEECMIDEFALPAAKDLATVHPHVVVFGCTSGGALRGSEFDRELCTQISSIAKAPVVSSIEATNEALAAVNAKKLLIITPYTDDLNKRLKKSIEETGLEVAGIFGMGITESFPIGQIEAAEIVRFTKEKIKGLNPDCLFISCTNFRAIEATPQLKADLGLPVVTSNQAALDKTLSLLKKR